jgi:hypothetical protein
MASIIQSQSTTNLGGANTDGTWNKAVETPTTLEASTTTEKKPTDIMSMIKDPENTVYIIGGIGVLALVVILISQNKK